MDDAEVTKTSGSLGGCPCSSVSADGSDNSGSLSRKSGTRMAPSRSQNSKESGNPEVHCGQRFIGQLKGAKSDRRSSRLLCWKNCLQRQRKQGTPRKCMDEIVSANCSFESVEPPRMVLRLSEIGIRIEQDGRRLSMVLLRT